jgi:hypothetical protein
MAVTVPVAGTEITVTNFGKPVADQLNALVPTAWTAVPLQNSWANYGAPYPTIACRKVGDVVYLRGLINGGTTNTICATLPVGFRPAHDTHFVVASNDSWGVLLIRTAGTIQVNAWQTAWISLANVVFSVTP